MILVGKIVQTLDEIQEHTLYFIKVIQLTIVSISSTESEYNLACTAGMFLAHFRMLIHELLNKDPHIIPEEDNLIISDSKSSVCMAKNGKYNKHTRHIARIMNLVRNGKKYKIHNID